MFLPCIRTASNNRKNVIFVMGSKANVLIEYFASVCVNGDGKSLPFSRPVPASAILNNIHFDTATALKFISKIRPKLTRRNTAVHHRVYLSLTPRQILWIRHVGRASSIPVEVCHSYAHFEKWLSSDCSNT